MTFARLLAVMLLLAIAVSAQSNPVPFIKTPLVPDAVAPGGPSFTLTVNGTGFVPGSVVQWNGTALATTFVSGSQLTATVPDAYTGQGGSPAVTVRNPAPGGGKSNFQYLSVRSATTAISFGQSAPFGLEQNVILSGTADFNGDGKLDLAFINSQQYTSSIEIALGNGDGTFQAFIDTDLTLYDPGQLTIGDFNRDGVPDMAVMDGSTTVVLLGHRDGTFDTVQPSALKSYFGIYGITNGDFNQDGKLDLAVGSYDAEQNPRIAILLGDGGGQFAAPQYFPVAGDLVLNVVAGDFNQDGHLDLAVASGNSTLVTGALDVLLGNGDGTFVSGASYDTDNYFLATICADFDGDGILDVAARTYIEQNSEQLFFFHGNGDGTFSRYPDTSLLGSSYVGLAVGDMNGDGLLDLVTATSYVTKYGLHVNDQLVVLYGRGAGTFDARYFATSQMFGLAGGDFNGDGKLDIAAWGYRSHNGPTELYLLEQSSLVTSSSFVVFGEVENGTKVTKDISVTNFGGEAVDIRRIHITQGYGYTQTNDCETSLPAGAHCTIHLTFAPEQNGLYNGAIININSSATLGHQEIGMRGAGVMK
ncbi:MAG: VCBS repeat-containing protein [Acidobacteriales bacterium]|nr:VCBS repeat-containing protein [Terriglobales bacterium]